MPLYGYARVSTLDQDLSIQRAALKAAGCDVIRGEKASDTRRDGRSELQVLLDFLRAGDTLVVTRIDRLARSLKDLQDIIYELKGRGVALKATEQPVDTGTAAGKAFLDMLGVFAEFETNLRRERQLEGISAAKARGVYKGREPSIDASEVHRLRHNDQIFVAPRAQRRGVGQALLDFSKQLMPVGFWLRTAVDNIGACRFYERHGFKLSETATHPTLGHRTVIYSWP